MSRNSKSARNLALAKSFKRAKFDGKKSVPTGNKGPSRTQPKHSKKKAWFQMYDTHGHFMDSKKKGAKAKKESNREDDVITT